ncbi:MULTISPECIES: hypothetical protein [Winogradskyella]|uniref:hypothetical protein n=1 Tax=Winogradskyella TaxID=286104 RepID=UPI00399ADB14
MKSKSSFRKIEDIKLTLLVITLGFVTIFSKSISNYVVKSYNDKIEFLASQTVEGANLIRY